MCNPREKIISEGRNWPILNPLINIIWSRVTQIIYNTIILYSDDGRISKFLRHS